MDESKGSQKNTGMAIVAYLIFFVPLLTEAKNDPFVKFHVKQGLVLFISYIVDMFIGLVPILGWIIAPILFLVLIVLLIIGIINAAGGKEKELPLIGGLAKNFKF